MHYLAALCWPSICLGFVVNHLMAGGQQLLLVTPNFSRLIMVTKTKFRRARNPQYMICTCELSNAVSAWKCVVREMVPAGNLPILRTKIRGTNESQMAVSDKKSSGRGGSS
jgi:hypothetical protein